MDHRLKSKLEALREDYENVSGKTFNYFWCPILSKDEDVELCVAHIINQAFPNPDNSERRWTAQRKDIDNFYGAMFEADFVVSKYRNIPITGDVIVNKELFQQLNPRIFLDDKDTNMFILKDNVSSKYPYLTVEEDEESVDIGIKISAADFQKALEGKWELDVSKDIRLPALVSLIKVAYLTMFELVGYDYALSPAGLLFGNILGKFFLENRNKKKAVVLENARKFFADYAHMVLIAESANAELKGTINDKTLLVCRRKDGTPWAYIVFVKVAEILNTVLIPVAQSVTELDTFLKFLKSDQETIQVEKVILTDQGLEGDHKILSMRWFKDIDFSFIDPQQNNPAS